MITIRIIYDNTTIRDDLAADWGFACLVETESHRILFDTGKDSGIFRANMEGLDIAPESVDTVFVSHCHNDHIGGLEALSLSSETPIYIPDTCTELTGLPSTHRIKEATQLHEDIFSTGELAYIEQSLVIRHDNQAIVVVGCSHPGVEAILTAAALIGKPRALIGGLHGFDQFELLESLEYVCPTHCTRFKDGIIERYPDKILPGGAGAVIQL